MQKISLGDKEYVKASEAAKRFKYTQDYIGQLCRGKKVDARLVGRVWYVNLESITEYRKTKHATQKKTAKNPPTNKPKTKTTPKPVEPVVRAKTARKLREIFPKEAKQAVTRVPATYSSDTAAIIPVMRVGTAAKETPIAPQKAKPSITIKVRANTTKSTSYTTEKLPEITLKSKLKVTDEFENLVPDTPESFRASQSQQTTNKPDSDASVTAPARKTPVQFQPVAVTTAKETVASDPNSAKRAPVAPLLRVLIFVVYFSSILLAVALVLGATYFTEVGSSVPTSGLTFNADVVLEKIQHFFQ